MNDFLIASGDDFVRLAFNGAEHISRRALEGSRAHRLWVSQNEIWVCTLGEGLWRSHDGGIRWSNFSPPLPASRVWSFAIGAPSNDASGALYAGGEDGALLLSRDAGKRWDWLDNLWLLPSSHLWRSPRVRAIAPHPLHPDWLLVSLRDVGVLFSSDGGYSWDEARSKAGNDVRQLCWHGTIPERALALSREGIAWSEDGGWTWQSSTFDFGGPLQSATFDCSSQLWLVISNAADSSRLWQGDGDKWSEVPTPGVKNARMSCVATLGDVWAAGFENGTVRWSDSSGRNWNCLTIEGETAQSICALMVVETPLKDGEP